MELRPVAMDVTAISFLGRRKPSPQNAGLRTKAVYFHGPGSLKSKSWCQDLGTRSS